MCPLARGAVVSVPRRSEATKQTTGALLTFSSSRLVIRVLRKLEVTKQPPEAFKKAKKLHLHSKRYLVVDFLQTDKFAKELDLSPPSHFGHDLPRL